MPDAAYDENYDWVTINDFTPGIYSQSRRVQLGVALPAPLGAAQESGTFRCIALAGGGLAPLPKLTAQYSVPLPAADISSLFGYFNVDGFNSFGPVGPGPAGTVDDWFLGIEYLTGANRIFTYYRVDPVSGADPYPADTLLSVTSTVLPSLEQYQGMTWAISRMNTGDSGTVSPNITYFQPGTPVIVTSWAPPSFSADRHVVAFPNPSSPGVTGVSELCIPNRPTSTGETQYGDILGHQGRIVMLEYLTNPFGARAGDAIPTNEQVSFSDPPNSWNALPLIGHGSGQASPYTIGTQQQVFVQEIPNGYGAWGSISAGELFLIKQQGGGVLITGDLASPTVTRLPGVVSAAGMVSRAASTMQGLIYYSRFSGAYMWRGGDTSDKISDAITDNFPFYVGGPDKLNSVSIHFQEWGDWCVATNNWLYDLRGGGWWRLDDPSVAVFQWYSRSYFGENLFAIPCHLNNTTKTGAIRQYSRQIPATSYQWTGQPIARYINRLSDSRDCVLVAMGSAGSTIQVNVTNYDGTTDSRTFTLPAAAATQAVRLRIAGMAARGYNVVPQIIATGSGGGAAPVVYSLSLGVRQGEEVVST